MSKILNKSDNSICPNPGVGKAINQTELAEIGHDECPHFNAILEMLMDQTLSGQYRLARIRMMIETLEEGLKYIAQADA